MVVYLKEYENDWVVMTNVAHAMKTFGGEVTALEASDLPKIKLGETLVICGHGWFGTIGRYGSKSLADTLTAHQFKPAGHPVILYACMGGVDYHAGMASQVGWMPDDTYMTLTGTPKGLPIQSLAKSLAGILKTKVTAAKGLALVSEAIRIRAVKVESTAAYLAEESKYLIARGCADKNGALYPIGQVKELAGCETIAPVSAKAQEVAKRTASVYLDLLKMAEEKDYMYAPDQGYQDF